MATCVPPGIDADLGDQIDVGERAAAQPDEPRRIEPLLEILQPVGDRVPLVPRPS